MGNNGGSRTIIISQKTLESLGHICDVIATVDNFSWFKHKLPIRQIPKNLDALIATACTTVKSTLQSNIPKKAWYIRGHETWSMPENELIKLYRLPKLNIVNSYGLKTLLKSFGAKSEVVYQGIDFEWWKDLDIRKDKIRIGCLCGKKPTKNWKDFVKLAKILGNKYEYVAYGDSYCDNNFLTEFHSNPTKDQLNMLYNSCHLWFAPTILEGLHNVGLEAALCGCLLVCNDNPMNGMCLDYAFKNKTAMVYSNLDEAVEMIKNPDYSLIPTMKDHLKTHISLRETNMKKMVKLLEV